MIDVGRRVNSKFWRFKHKKHKKAVSKLKHCLKMRPKRSFNHFCSIRRFQLKSWKMISCWISGWWKERDHLYFKSLLSKRESSSIERLESKRKAIQFCLLWEIKLWKRE